MKMFRNTALAGTSTVKLIVGFGLCTLGGAMLFAYFKNRDEEDEVIPPTKTKTYVQKSPKKQNQLTSEKPENVITINVLVSNEHIPLIVGRAGANLRLIEEQTRTKINLRDKNETHKYCEITGLSSDVIEARSLLVHEIERSPIVKEEILVPQSVCGQIMGRCGEAMQEICRISLAKVTIDSGGGGGNGRNGNAANKRRIVITGNRQQVNIARKLLEDRIAEDEDLRRAVEQVEQHREPRRSPSNSLSSSLYSSQTSLSSHVPPRDKMLAARCDEKPMEVYVSAIASPAKFWVQLIGPQAKKLDDMVQAMTEYYGIAENRDSHHINEPYLGQIVAAVFKYDGKWYRAEIVGILPNQYNSNEVVLDLYFVDYGDSEYVSPHEVFELRTDFLTLRFQAVECFLANVKSTNTKDPETWDPLAIQKFEELTQVANWKKLIARVVTYKERPKATAGVTPHSATRDGSSIPGVEIFDLTEDVEVNLGHMLISHGFALPTDERPRSPYYYVGGSGGVAVGTSPENSIYRPQSPSSSASASDYLTPNGTAGTNINMEDAVLEQQLQHLRKNNNLYLNDDHRIAAAAAETAANIHKLSAEEFINDNYDAAPTMNVNHNHEHHHKLNGNR